MSQIRLALLAGVVAVAIPGAALASGWTAHPRSGFVIELRAAWRVVPHSPAATRALANRLQAQGHKQLAAQYRSVADDPYQWQSAMLFHAFQWPQPAGAALITDALVMEYPSRGAPLSTLAHELASKLRKQHGTHVSAPVRLVGANGGVYFRFEARAKLDSTYGAPESDNLTYLYEHGGKLYVLFVRGETDLGSAFHVLANRVGYDFRLKA
jgi:hypothetical protein